MSMFSTIDCLDNPMMFFLKDGSLFKAISFKSKRHFTTEFFLITKINTTKNCLTLMLLRPCTLCCDKMVLMPMDEFITIDMSCFCGYQSIPNVCVRECHHPPIQITDCVCGPFTMMFGVDETVLWQSNLLAEQCGTINLYIRKGEKVPLKIRIYFNDQRNYETYQLIDEKSYKFSVTDCSRIIILRSNTDTQAKVQGIFEIKWQSVIEN